MSTGESTGPRAGVPSWTRQRRRRGRYVLTIAVGAAIVASLAAGMIRTIRLWGLPDAPAPFNVAEFESVSVPDDRNAISLFREARQVLGGPSEPWSIWGSRTTGKEWAQSGPEVWDWVAKHRPALELWRRGTERPDAWMTRPFAGQLSMMLTNDLPNWARFALLEANRHEDAGDLAGAWAWHRASLRATLLSARRGSILERRSTSYFFDEVAARIRFWAGHADMSAPLLRAAIADVEAMAPLHGTEADSLKRDYIQLMAEIDDPDLALRLFEPPPNGPKAPPLGSPSARVTLPEPLRSLYRRADLYLQSEPERSRRVARMIFANWLTQADKPAAERAKVLSAYPLVFGADPTTTPSLPPADLARRAADAPLFALIRGGFAAPPASWPIPDHWPRLLSADRRARASLIVALAVRIYEIEAGQTPADHAQLVGKVIPKLPDDYVPPEGGDVLPAPTSESQRP